MTAGVNRCPKGEQLNERFEWAPMRCYRRGSGPGRIGFARGGGAGLQPGGARWKSQLRPESERDSRARQCGAVQQRPRRSRGLRPLANSQSPTRLTSHFIFARETAILLGRPSSRLPGSNLRNNEIRELVRLVIAFLPRSFRLSVVTDGAGRTGSPGPLGRAIGELGHVNFVHSVSAELTYMAQASASANRLNTYIQNFATNAAGVLATHVAGRTGRIPTWESGTGRTAGGATRAPYVARADYFVAQDLPEGNVFYGLVESDGTTYKPAFQSYVSAATY